ncbi:unnamed protein product [Paramecium sonneborni]|uniref:Uncharacterized protein n=1 Tax=Paramecium sonneborni TaxID=65129 RepID=A0A8S1RVF2_9CILI|nr:unnamed protein product [Paramecium sonneborni]
MRFNPTSFIKDINRAYNNQNSKATSKLESYHKFPEYNQCKQSQSDLQIVISKCGQFQKLDDNSINKKIELKNQISIQQSSSLQEEDVKLNLIDQSIKQVDCCVSIAFNSFGTIMVSTEKKVIKVWSFKNGRMQLQQSLEQHSGGVNCLIYNRIQDAFLSSSSDKTIRIWKQKRDKLIILSITCRQGILDDFKLKGGSIILQRQGQFNQSVVIRFQQRQNDLFIFIELTQDRSICIKFKLIRELISIMWQWRE